MTATRIGQWRWRVALPVAFKEVGEVNLPSNEEIEEDRRRRYEEYRRGVAIERMRNLQDRGFM